MKRLWLAGVLGALLCALQISAIATEKNVLKVTRDNFIWLDYQSVGGIAGLKTQIEITGGEIILEEFPRLGGVGLEKNLGLFSGQPLPSIRPRMRLSNNQLGELVNQINKARLPALAGEYRQPNLADGLNETLTLIISDAKNQDQTFVIENYGDKAPAGFYQFTNYLRQLRSAKFRGTSEPAVVSELVTRENFKTLTFETSGGYAGIRATTQIESAKKGDVLSATLNWSQQIGGGKTNGSVGLTDAEFSELIRLSNTAKLPKLNGKSFRDEKLFDGFNEVLTLSLQDGRSYTVSNYGNRAPVEYSALARYLHELKNKKTSSR